MTVAAGSTVRYVLGSAGCFCLHNVIMIACDRAGLTMMQSAGAAFCIMVVVGYLVMAGPVFRSLRTWLGFWRYVLAMALNFPIVTTLLWIFMNALNQPMSIAAPSAAITMVLINFILSRWAVIGRSMRTGESAVSR